MSPVDPVKLAIPETVESLRVKLAAYRAMAVVATRAAACCPRDGAVREALASARSYGRGGSP